MSNTRAFGTASLVLALVAAGGVVWASYGLIPARPARLQPVAQAAPSAAAWVGVLGLDAESLTAAGVSVGEASQLFGDLQAYFADSGALLLQAVDAHNAAQRVAVNDDRTIRAGKEIDGDLLAAHRQAAAAAQADRLTRVNSAFAAATARLPTEVVQRLTMIESNRSREVPAAYRLLSRTDAQWVQLRDALTAERQAAGRNEETPQEARGFLTDIRADPAVAAALQRVATTAGPVGNALRGSP